jgi:hypothetical protein
MFVEPPGFHAVSSTFDAGFFRFNGGGEVALLGLQFGPSIMVSSVVFDFCKGSGVIESPCCLGQSVVGTILGLEYLDEPVGHGRCGAL